MSEQKMDGVNFHRIAKVDDLPYGERLFFELDGKPIVLFVLDGEFLAIADLCSHDQGPVGEGELEGDAIVCPRHGAKFNVRTGKVLSFPAVTDIPVYPVRIKDDYLEVGIPQG